MSAANSTRNASSPAPRPRTAAPVLWIVVPAYNEELVLAQTVPMFLDELDTLIAEHGVSPESLILFVDDSSSDATWQIVSSLARREPHVAAIRQSRNRGHQSSVLAGLMEARGRADITISIDCDGQDDIHAMEEMVDCWWDGYDVVYGVRSSRKTDSWAKRFTAQSYYKMLSSLGAEVVYNH
ncbi:MAG: glycosyltransferase family 2 protein, partial [Coriobacteriales bacterium]|nr:glycosyltransferase family 2 protein [Coriobacteriales bacterium]